MIPIFCDCVFFQVNSCSFSPDGERIVSCSYDRTVRVWDAVTGAQVLQLEGHSEGVSGVVDNWRIQSSMFVVVFNVRGVGYNVVNLVDGNSKTAIITRPPTPVRQPRRIRQ